MKSSAEIPGSLYLILGIFIGIASYFLFQGKLLKSVLFFITSIVFIIIGIYKILSKREKKDKIITAQKPLVKYCARCGNALREFDNFCYKCGHKFFYKK